MDNQIVVAPPTRFAWYVDRKSIERPIAGVPDMTGVPDMPTRGAESTRRRMTPIRGWCGDLGHRTSTLPTRSTQPVRESVQDIYFKSYLAQAQQDVPVTSIRFPDLRKDEERRFHATSFPPGMPNVAPASTFTGDHGESTRQHHFRTLRVSGGRA
jgi:hypothetical protein